MIESHEGDGDSTGLAMTAVRQRPHDAARPDTTLRRHPLLGSRRRKAVIRAGRPRTAHAGQAKSWKGLGSRVYDLVENHRGDPFRAVGMVRVADAMHVLHAFRKKSKSGVAMP